MKNTYTKAAQNVLKKIYSESTETRKSGKPPIHDNYERKLDWNKVNPNDRFTKEEFIGSNNFTAFSALPWNFWNKRQKWELPLFTKEEVANAPDLTRHTILEWNKSDNEGKFSDDALNQAPFQSYSYLHTYLTGERVDPVDAPKYTKEEIANHPKFDAQVLRFWNMHHYGERFTKEEFKASKGFDYNHASDWNNEHNPEQFTDDELRDLHWGKDWRTRKRK